LKREARSGRRSGKNEAGSSTFHDSAFPLTFSLHKCLSAIDSRNSLCAANMIWATILFCKTATRNGNQKRQPEAAKSRDEKNFVKELIERTEERIGLGPRRLIAERQGQFEQFCISCPELFFESV
jgi:hypothetical protein